MSDSNLKFPIYSGLPVPKTKRKAPTGGGGRTTQFPFSQMDVGDAFFAAENDQRADKTIIASFTAAARRWRKSTGNEAMKFVARVDAESERVGCYRIK